MAQRSQQGRNDYVAAWKRAKAANPTLTQAEFFNEGRARAGMPRVSPDSASRYHRKIISGERSGADIMAEAQKAREKGLYQIQFFDRAANKWRTQNIEVANAKSTFDIVAIEAELQNRPAIIETIVNRFRERYGKEAVAISSRRFSVRQVAKQRRQTIQVVI